MKRILIVLAVAIALETALATATEARTWSPEERPKPIDFRGLSVKTAPPEVGSIQEKFLVFRRLLPFTSLSAEQKQALKALEDAFKPVEIPPSLTLVKAVGPAWKGAAEEELRELKTPDSPVQALAGLSNLTEEIAMFCDFVTIDQIPEEDLTDRIKKLLEVNPHPERAGFVWGDVRSVPDFKVLAHVVYYGVPIQGYNSTESKRTECSFPVAHWAFRAQGNERGYELISTEGLNPFLLP